MSEFSQKDFWFFVSLPSELLIFRLSYINAYKWLMQMRFFCWETCSTERIFIFVHGSAHLGIYVSICLPTILPKNKQNTNKIVHYFLMNERISLFPAKSKRILLVIIYYQILWDLFRLSRVFCLALLHWLFDQFPWEIFKTLYPQSDGLIRT